MSDKDLPEELQDTLSLKRRNIYGSAPVRAAQAEDHDALEQHGAIGNAWVLMGVFLLVAIGVILLIIFASSGNATESMFL